MSDIVRKYIIALTNLYGQVKPTKVAEIFNEQNETNISTQGVKAYLDEDLSKNYVFSYKNHFVHETVMEFDMFKDLLKKKRNLSYYIPDKEELLKYTDVTYYEKPESYLKLKQLLEDKYFKKDTENAEMLTQNIRHKCLDGMDDEKFINLMTNYNIMPENQKEASKIINLVTELSNNIRRWELNGHTLEEIKSMDIDYKLSLLDRIKAFFKK